MNKSILRFFASASLVLCGQTTILFAQPLPLDPEIRQGVLQNGLTYFIRHNTQTPGQADFYIANRVGSVLESPDKRGLAHFLEHMAFNGTENFPDGNGGKNSIRAWCEKNGIKFGVDLNAYTSLDETVYNIANAPVSKSGVVDTCLLILRDWASSILLESEEIDNERGVIREEWRTRRSGFATTRMMEEAMPVIYAGSKYEDCLPIGHIEVIDTFPHQKLREFYKDWYRPDLQAVIVVGDINVDSVENNIKTLFGSIPSNPDSPRRSYFPVPDNEEMIVYVKGDDEQPTLNFSLYMKRDAEPRENKNSRQAYLDAYKSKLAMFILRQRLAELTHEASPKLMSANVRDNSFYVTPEKDAFAVTIGLLPDAPKAGIDAVFEVVEKAKRFGFTQHELDHAKIQHTVQISHKLDNRQNTRNAEYVRSILSHFLNGEPAMDIADEAVLQNELNEIITLDDINSTIREIITDSNQVLIAFGPSNYDGQPYTLPADALFKEWVLAAQSKDYVDDNDYKEVDAVFMSQMPQKGSIISKTPVENGYTEYLLSNGVKVSARPSEIEPNRLTINMFRLGGRSLYDDEDAASLQFLNTVIRESGASDFDYLTLEKKRRGKALRVTPYINAEDEGVNGVCAASDFKTWLEVMYLYLTKPRRDDDIFSNIIAKQRSLLKNRNANPNVDYKDSLRLTVYGKSKKSLPISVERLNEVNLDRIYEIYNERFKDLSGMHLIVTGDIREDEFEDLICQYVASLPGNFDSELVPAVGNNTFDIQKGNILLEFNKDMKTPSALTNIVYSAELPYTAENDLKLDVLSQLMRAIFTEKIREEQGGTYGVSVSGQFWKYPKDGCSLTVNFRCDPERYQKLLPIIDMELQEMAINGPSDSQLQNVKEYERKNYDRAILTNGWWEYVRYHQLHDGIDFGKDYPAMVDNLSVEEIKEFCNQILDSGNRIQVTMHP